MQKITNIMTKTALAIITAVLATGCIFEKMDMPKDLQNVLIQINVSADELQTKAEPLVSESTINTLYVYAFYGNVLVGYHAKGSTTAEEHFLMDLALPSGTAIPVDFFLIANASSMKDHNNPVVLTETMTRAQLESLRYTGLVENSVLPLYAKETKNLNTAEYKATYKDGHEGHLLLDQQVSFELSRSLAKLSVYGAKPADATTSPEILSLSILAAGTREFSYLFPQTSEILNSVTSRQNDRALISERVELGKLTGDGTSASHYTPVTSSVTYLPEVAVGGTASEWATMVSERQVTLKMEYKLNSQSTVKTAFIYMPEIERNTHYKVCILISEEDEGRIYVNYVVADWNDHVMPGYTFTYPSHSYLRSSVPTTSGDTSKPGSNAVMSLTKPFVGYFQMTAPANDAWIPTLIGNYASDADIKVYDYTTGDLIPENEWPIAVSSRWYRITVTPHNDFIIGNKIDLAITYKPDMVTFSEYLLINGSSGNFYWPGSTDANFVTITMVN